MAEFATNTELSLAQMTPMVSIKLELAGQGASLTDFSKRVLLLGHRQSGYLAALHSEVKLNTQADANRNFGPQSEIAALFAHLQGQLSGQGAGGAEIYAMAVAEPVGGVKATKLFRFVATPTTAGAPGSNSAALRQHSATIRLAGWRFPFAIQTGDTFAQIATNAASAITSALTASQGQPNCPVDSVSVLGDTVTVTVAHSGSYLEDFPCGIEFSDDQGGVVCSPGKVTLAGPATSNGLVIIGAGSLSVSTSVANGDTAATVCGKVTSNIIDNPSNVGIINNNLVAAGELILLYDTGHVVQRLAASSTATGLTTTLATGTTGTGVPDLTLALTALRKSSAKRIWVVPWNAAAVLGQIELHRAEMANGLRMKDQFVIIGSTAELVTAGAIPLSSTPKLTSTPWWAEILCPDAEIRGADLAAHAAGTAVGSDTPAQNFDWLPLKTSGAVPLGAPHPDVQLDPLDTANTAMLTYRLTPLVVNPDTGELCILRAVTTAVVATDELSNWSTVFCLGYARAFVVGKLQNRFIRPPSGSINSRLMVKKVGDGQSPGTVKKETIEDSIKEYLDNLEQGTGGSVPNVVDGADELKKFVRAAYNKINSGRIDAVFPIRTPQPLHQIALVEQHVL